MKKDWRSEPFKTYCAIGDSITAGGSATLKEKCWVSRLSKLISDFQGVEITTFNLGLGGSILSRCGPAYLNSQKPTGLERYKRDVLIYNPDIATIAYGTNDIRGGNSVEQLSSDMDFLIRNIAEESDTLILILSFFHMNVYCRGEDDCWGKGSRELFIKSNEILKECAEKNDVLYADVYGAMGEAVWIVDLDGGHPNDLGHALIANKVFETLAVNCSCLSRKPYADAVNYPAWRDESFLCTYEGINSNYKYMGVDP